MSDDQSAEGVNPREGDQGQQVVSDATLIHQKSYEVESYQAGPLPDPSSLGEYDQVLVW